MLDITKSKPCVFYKKKFDVAVLVDSILLIQWTVKNSLKLI